MEPAKRDKKIVALVIPAERALCPYVDLYTSVLDRAGIACVIIEWDRLHSGGSSYFSYCARKSSARMGLVEYLKYSYFVRRVLNDECIRTLIVFSLPLLLVLYISGVLRNRVFGIDIRDHHKSLSLSLTRSAIKRAALCAISSPGFYSWLPPGVKATISHNAHALISSSLAQSAKQYDRLNQKRQKLVVGTIGQLKDLQANIVLISQLGGDNGYILKYSGTGAIDDDLKKICYTRKLSNVVFTGRYESSQEPQLYSQCDVISMLMTPGTTNNNTLMANRVYNSVLYGLPLIAFSGTFLSRIVDKYKLGIIIDTPDQLKQLDKLLSIFHNNLEEFDRGRCEFKKWVQGHQLRFSEDLLNFLTRSDADGGYQ